MPNYKQDEEKNTGVQVTSLPVELIMKIGEELVSTPHQLATFFSINKKLTNIHNSLHFNPTLKKLIQNERLEISSKLVVLEQNNPQRYGEFFHQFNQRRQPNCAAISQKLSSLFLPTFKALSLAGIIMLALFIYTIYARLKYSFMNQNFVDIAYCFEGLSIILLACLILELTGKIMVDTISSSMNFINNHRDTLISKPIGFFSPYQKQLKAHADRLQILDVKEREINERTDLSAEILPEFLIRTFRGD